MTEDHVDDGDRARFTRRRRLAAVVLTVLFFGCLIVTLLGVPWAVGGVGASLALAVLLFVSSRRKRLSRE